jgi:hypothetical protein
MLHRTISLIGDPRYAAGKARRDPLRAAYCGQSLQDLRHAGAPGCMRFLSGNRGVLREMQNRSSSAVAGPRVHDEEVNSRESKKDG